MSISKKLHALSAKTILLFSVSVLIFSFFSPVVSEVSGMSDEQRAIYNSGSSYFDIATCATPSNSTSDSTPSESSTKGVEFTTGMTVNTDGVGSSHGNPYHQSQTSYADGKLNADETNYLALAQGYAQAHNLKLGDLAAVQYKGKTSYAIYADNWQNVNEVHGEGSYRLVKELGMSFDGNSGGAESGVKYTMYPNTASKLNGSVEQSKIDEAGKQLFGVSSSTSGSDSESSGSSNCACATGESAAANGTLRGNDNPEKVFNFMIDTVGLSKEQAAGALGRPGGVRGRVR